MVKKGMKKIYDAIESTFEEKKKADDEAAGRSNEKVEEEVKEEVPEKEDPIELFNQY